ncbi:hypothetical protein X798_05010 [Onchocerca flexuosa]|uniref:DNA-directed RNA polymerase III subunit RPC10 n=1 Tax=Onchocerca flexuosa TaxID=387005 RepID=A0A238BSN4_9BILA|nr:hypothetical protein X798_05010 [Onchocerca flexuosa]
MTNYCLNSFLVTSDKWKYYCVLFIDEIKSVQKEADFICSIDDMDVSMAVDRDKNTGNDTEELINMKGFRFKEILAEDGSRKVAFVLLDVNDCSSNQAILIVERTPFPLNKEDWNAIVSQCSLKTLSTNDVYSNHLLFPPEKFAGIKTTLINPCTEKHIAKYRDQKRYVIHETPDDYKSITLPHLDEHQFTLKWIFNLLDHKAEVDRIILDDVDPHNGFVLAPDLKWDGENLANLYVLAIIRRKGIKSIRDLTANDLPLLENICQKSYMAIKEKYGIDKHQIRAYFHYQPSFYHLHVHFIHVSYDAPASSVGMEYMLLFCPECGSSLQIEEGSNCYQFNCHNCPYVHPVTKIIRSRHYPKLKDLDEVLGGPSAWENAQITDERCPRCSGDRAYFMQLQTRSADEPMTVFYRCANSECAYRWKE